MKKINSDIEVNRVTQKKTITSILIENGFSLPIKEDDVDKSHLNFGTTDILLPEEVDSPNFIFERFKDEIEDGIGSIIPKNSNKAKVVQLDKNALEDIKGSLKKENHYFKKIVLAAEIASQLHSEPTFGHIKFVKVLYLCQEVGCMQLSTVYNKHAAGPFDPKFLKSADAEFKKKRWFKISLRENGYGFIYEPDVNLDEYKEYYLRYFSKQIDLIERIVNLLRKEKSSFCEVVATSYAVWKELLYKRGSIHDEDIIRGFYEWNKSKQKFERIEVQKALEWMKTHEVYPNIPSK
ncbi:MAG: type restriction modification specificity domain protein [Segetibacter sp.]|nr:type restriction modification specificity domain protein [Segetibacter sp.]